MCLAHSRCAEDSAHYNAGSARREVSCLIGRRRAGWHLSVSLHHFAAAGLRAAHGRDRALCRAGNRHVRHPQSGLVRTRFELRSETESWKIASFLQTDTSHSKNKARQTHTISLGNFTDYVIRRFSASSAELKSPRALDLRWDCRLTRSPGPTGTLSQPMRVAYWKKCHAGSRFLAELDCGKQSFDVGTYDVLAAPESDGRESSY